MAKTIWNDQARQPIVVEIQLGQIILAVLSRSQQVFVTRCALCHGRKGQGLVGSNLTDDYWIHGSDFKDNLRTICDGIPEKGMLSWKGILKPGEILAAASYIYTLRGTRPLNPKLPENQLLDEPLPQSPFE